MLETLDRVETLETLDRVEMLETLDRVETLETLDRVETLVSGGFLRRRRWLTRAQGWSEATTLG